MYIISYFSLSLSPLQQSSEVRMRKMAAYRLPLFGVTYVSSFVFLVEYIAVSYLHRHFIRQKGCESTSEIHILFLWICRFCSCATLYPYLYILGYGSGACHHPALYFYHFQTDTALSFFPDYRPGASAVKEELETAYTASFITICFSAILMYYIERGAQPEVFKISETEYGGLSSRLPP